jgi:hypothetical protein
VRALPVLLLALALGPGASARTPSPCALLTNHEVAKTFGVKVEERTASPREFSCSWKGASLGGFIPSQPQLTLSVTSNRIAKAEFIRDFSLEIVPGPTPGKMERDPALVVRGVGQVAFAGLHGQELSVWDRGVVVQITTALVGSPLETAKRLARLVLARFRAG